MRILLALALLLAIAAPARADVAMLPLNADPWLEIYGQPVASELARALVAGNVAVVVVGPKMAVPERARLIIDGTIALGKASAVTISIRIRNTLDGMILETLSATAPGLAKIDGWVVRRRYAIATGQKRYTSSRPATTRSTNARAGS